MKIFHSNCIGCDASAFFVSFTDFVRSVMSDSLNLNDNQYRKWIECRIKCFGSYANIKENKIGERLLRDVNLCEDLKMNGLNMPIVMTWKKDGFEIDGYHRLVIWEKLGNDKIRYTVR